MRLAQRVAACVLIAISGVSQAPAARPPDDVVQPPPVAPATVPRDGQHDFDFNVGVWETHIHRILKPLSGSADSSELNGTVTVHKIWDGRAQLEEIEAEGPQGHWEGMPDNGRSILVRFTMIPISPTTARSEQAFSDDGGKTWETNWIN